MADEKKVETVKAPTTELEEAPVEERPVMKPHVAQKGWVKDANGRFHEVDDVALTLQAYPGMEQVKASEVMKSKVGYEGGSGAPEGAPTAG